MENTSRIGYRGKIENLNEEKENYELTYTVTETKNTVLNLSELLVYLNQYHDDFPGLKSLVYKRNLRPSVILLPSVLKQLDEDLENNVNILYEAIDYMELIKFYSVFLFNDSEIVFGKIKDYVINNRIAKNPNYILAKNRLDDFYFVNYEEANALLDNNKIIIAIYIFTIVTFILNKG